MPICAPPNDVGILPRQERSSWGFIWPFVTHKMSLCVRFFTGQGARATQSTQLPRDPDAWRLVTRETSEALQKCFFPLLGKLLSCFRVRMIFFFLEVFLSITAGHLVKNINCVKEKRSYMSSTKKAIISKCKVTSLQSLKFTVFLLIRALAFLRQMFVVVMK